MAALTELQERGGCVVEQQQDTRTHVDGPGMVSVEHQHIGAGAVRGVYKVLETEHPIRREGTSLTASSEGSTTVAG